MALHRGGGELALKADVEESLAGKVDVDSVYTKSEINTSLNSKANNSLDNLTETAEEHFFNKTQITNCIVENPKLVNLELSNGVLTLKAGSIVIYPCGKSAPIYNIGDAWNGGEIVDISWDGTNLFYYVKILHDSQTTYTASNAYNVAIYVSLSGILDINGNPSWANTGTEAGQHYNPETNIISRYDSGDVLVGTYCSFPIGYCNITKDVGITDVFTEFKSIGYIGNVIWVGKNVKVLSPNGINEHGKLNNAEKISTKVSVSNSISAISYLNSIFYNINSQTISLASWVHGTSPKDGYFVYDWRKNIFITPQGGIQPGVNLCYIRVDDNRIVEWKLNSDLNIVNNNPCNLAELGKPSDSYYDLTLGASGTSYRAISDGYISLIRVSTGGGQEAKLRANVQTQSISSTSNQYLSVYIPVRRGQTFIPEYYGGNAYTFRFHYSVGASI